MNTFLDTVKKSPGWWGEHSHSGRAVSILLAFTLKSTTVLKNGKLPGPLLLIPSSDALATEMDINRLETDGPTHERPKPGRRRRADETKLQSNSANPAKAPGETEVK